MNEAEDFSSFSLILVEEGIVEYDSFKLSL